MDLVAVVEAALEVVRPAAEAKDITIHRALAASPQIVVGDGDRLQQIAWNLLSNSVKFTRQGRPVDVSVATRGDNVVFEVRDDGVGIEPAFLPHVFDRFRQADGSLVRRHGGLGLGLSIVRELTELHGGQVSASSDGPGRGATFAVLLPRPAGQPAAPHRAGAAGAGRLQNIRVLVVDDDADARELAAMAISGAGGVAVAVDSAARATAVLAAQRFDVILSDLAMPDTDGFAFLRSLRADAGGPAARTPVIAVTAHAGATAEDRARDSGFDAVVTKPYDLETLFAAVRTPPTPRARQVTSMPLIVFDLDGTLIDSGRDLADSTNEMLASYGVRPLPVDDVVAMVGEGAKVLVERALAATGITPPLEEALARFRAIHDRRLLEHDAAVSMASTASSPPRRRGRASRCSPTSRSPRRGGSSTRSAGRRASAGSWAGTPRSRASRIRRRCST